MVVGLRYSLVDQPARQRVLSFVLRTLGILLLVIGMCRPYWGSQRKDLHVLFLVDVSQSVDLAAVDTALDEVQQAIDGLESQDSSSLFFIANGFRNFESTEEAKALLKEWTDTFADAEFRSESRLAEALRETRFAFPAGKSHRIVLFSDGQETREQLSASLSQLEEEDVDVRIRNLPGLANAEASVVAIRPSTSRAFDGEVIRMSADLMSNQNMNATLRILHKGVSIQEQNVTLAKDKPLTAHFDVEMTTSGASLWEAELIPEQDHFPLNNRLSCTVNVRGKARVLVLHTDSEEMRPISRALREQDIDVDVRGKFGLPEDLQGMLAFDAIVIANLPATSMAPRQMENLKRYVSEFGGGLAMLGSDNSFGLGGYYKTPVEEVLPLVSRFEKEKEKPSLAMVLVIDKSGSMSGMPIALARQAAKSAVELLGPRDSIGVVGFDSRAFVVSEMRSAAESDAIQASIDSLAAGGGTYMYTGMVTGKDMLENATAKIRHMIVLSDGHTQPADHEGLVQGMADANMTVSTVALGGADKQLLSGLAEIGRGRYYETDDPANVPQIFTKETMQASKSAIKEDLFGSVAVGDHPMLSGYRGTELPFSLGYVMTEAKPTAQVLLVTETGDPLLAVSRFGLGTGLAFTSDLSERWGGEWLAWSECGKFWAQAIRGIIRKTDSAGMQVTQSHEKDRWRLDIVRTAADGSPISGITWDASALNEIGKKTSVVVEEVGLGRYRAELPLESATQLTWRLRDTDHEKQRVLSYNKPYSSEYRLSAKLPKELEQLAAITPETIREDVKPVRVRKSVAHWAQIAALVCLLSGILVRRI